MKTISLGFIGGGRITRIFLKAFANKKTQFESVMVFDTNAEVCASLKNQFPEITIVETLEQVAKQPVLFIALHAPSIMETLEKMKEIVSTETVVISLAPKITIEKIASKLKTGNLARMIPNATSYINEGYNPICFSSEFSASKKQSLTKMLMLLGHTFEVTENKLEAYALISGMLPTYFWFQWDELNKLGTQMGLDEEESKETVRQTLKAANNLMYQSGLSFEQMMELIPVKPIAEYQAQIIEIYQSTLMELFEKIKP